MKLKKIISAGIVATMIMASAMTSFGAETTTITIHPEGTEHSVNVTITNFITQTDGTELNENNGIERIFYCTAPVTITANKPIEEFTAYSADADFKKFLPVHEGMITANDINIISYEDTGESVFSGPLDSNETLTIAENGAYLIVTGAFQDGYLYFVVGGDAPADTTASKPAATTPVEPANPAPVSVPVAPTNPAPVAAPVAQPKPAVAAATYTVQEGDTLAKLAKKYYGDGKQYTKIFEANKDKLKSPHLIKVGQTLVIPK